MTNDEAAALALYDLADEMRAYAVRQRGLRSLAAMDLYALTLERAHRLDLGDDLYDPAIQRTGADLRRNISKRAEASHA